MEKMFDEEDSFENIKKRDLDEIEDEDFEED
jgi:hypothetical protein